MKRIGTSVFLSLLCHIILAQAPGYLGKKTPIGIDLHSFPTINRTLFQGEDFSVNIRPGFHIERVIRRNFSIGTALSQYSTRAPYDFNSRRGEMQISGFALGLQAIFYSFKRRGNIAPLGPFQRFEIAYLRYDIEDLDRRFYADQREDLGSYQDLALSVTFGTQRIIKNTITYQIGLEAGWLFNTFLGTLEGSELYLKDTSNARLRGHFALNLHVGVGLILF